MLRLLPAAGFILFVVHYELGTAVLAGLFSYTILDVTHRRFTAWIRPDRARWLSVAAFTVIAAALILLIAQVFRQSAATVPVILASALPMASDFAAKYGISLPFESIDDLRLVAVEAVRENARSITRASGVLTRGFYHLAMAVAVAVLCFASDPLDVPAGNLWGAFAGRAVSLTRRFMGSFERVIVAQVLIASLNTAVTAVFLLAMSFPHVQFLVPATFFLGMLPIVGNLLSNTMIICTGLTVSPRLGLAALLYLVLIHKAEYFLNSRIVGSTLHAPMWQTLLGILIGELVLGVPGIILAPAALHFVREEMSALPEPRPS